MNQASFTKTSIEIAFKEYLESKALSSSGISRRLLAIREFWKWLDQENLEAEEVNYNDLLLYMKHKSSQGASRRTVQYYMGVINHFYAHLLAEGKVAINPAKDIIVKGVKRKLLYAILQPYELQQLYNQYPNNTPRDKRNKVILGLLVNQGLKTEELGKLEVTDVNLREGKITVPGSRKSSSREMRLEAHQVMAMHAYVLTTRGELLIMNPKRKSQTKQATDKLFIGQGGNCANFSSIITQLMKKVRKQHRINIINARQIRASVITKWLKNYNLREVQYLAGHRYISSTESYLQNDVEGLKEELQQFHPLG